MPVAHIVRHRPVRHLALARRQVVLTATIDTDPMKATLKFLGADRLLLYVLLLHVLVVDVAHHILLDQRVVV